MTKKTKLPVKNVSKKDIMPEPDMSIIADHKRPAPPLPIETFGAWSEWINTAAKSKCAPVDYIAISLLSATSSLIANTRQVSPWKGWTEPTILWGLLEGNPSSNKSPALDVVRDVFRLIENNMAEQYKVALDEYDQKKFIADTHKENWQKQCKEAIKVDAQIPVMPEEAKDAEEPARPRLCVGDVTIEKLADIAMQNPRGLCLCRDEFAALLTNMDRYGGSDREFYLEAYGGRKHIVDRKKNDKPCIVERLSIALLGTIQPEKQSKVLLESEDDGLAVRFLYAYPEPIPFYKPTERYESAQLYNAFVRLYNLPFLDQETSVVYLSDKAEKIFTKWRESLQKKEESEQGLMVSFMGKMPGVIVRLAITLCYLDWALLEEKHEPKQISDIYLSSAITLVDDYFIPMARRVFGDYALPKTQLHALIIAKWIISTKRECFNLRDMRREDRVLPTADAKLYEQAINELVEHGWVTDSKERDSKTNKGRYQKTYQVNPKVFEHFE